MAKLSIPPIIIFLFLIFSFLYLAYNATMAAIFIFLIILYALLNMIDPHISYPIQRTTKWLKSITLAVIGYAVLIISATIILPIARLIGDTLNLPALQSITGPMSLVNSWNIITSTQSTIFSNFAAPVLAESLTLYVILIIFLIPLPETFAHIKIFEYLKDSWNIKDNFRNLKMWGVFLIVSTIFMFLHLSAKLAEGATALIIVFLFMMVTLAIAVYEKEMKAAVIFHVLANTIAIWATASTVLPITTILLVGGLFYLLINFRKVRQVVGV